MDRRSVATRLFLTYIYSFLSFQSRRRYFACDVALSVGRSVRPSVHSGTAFRPILGAPYIQRWICWDVRGVSDLGYIIVSNKKYRMIKWKWENKKEIEKQTKKKKKRKEKKENRKRDTKMLSERAETKTFNMHGHWTKHNLYLAGLIILSDTQSNMDVPRKYASIGPSFLIQRNFAPRDFMGRA